MPRRIRSRLLDGWRDPEAVFTARYADAPYAVWLDGGADATAGVSIMAAAHRSSELVTADVARGTVTRSTPLGARRLRVGDRGIGLRPAGRAAPDRPSRRGGGGSSGGGARRRRHRTARLVRVVRVRARRPAQRRAHLAGRRPRMPRSSSSTGPSCSTTARAPCDSCGSTPAGPGTDEGERWAEELAEALQREPAASVQTATPVARPTMPAAPAPARWRHDPRRYAELIARCQEAIVRGDAYQLCLTNRVDVDVRPDPAVGVPRAARVEPQPSRRIRAVRRHRPAQRVARAVPPRRRRRHRLDEADEGHAPARSGPAARTPSCGASSSRARRSAPRTS